MTYPAAKIKFESALDELVMKAKTDSASLGKLYEHYYDRIYRFCLHRLFTVDSAEDMTSAVFLTMARKIHDFRGNTNEEFRRWIYSIAANHCNSYIRKNLRRKELFNKMLMSLNPGDYAIDDEEASEDIRWPVLYAAIKQLSPRHQTVLTLRYFENIPTKEIATILKIRYTTVRVSIYRAIKTLQRQLKTISDGGYK